jgi:adenosine kinase
LRNGLRHLEHGDYVTACRYGNAMGAQRCSGSDLRIYRALAETRAQIIGNYGGELVTHA